jgi:hypothetical protein
LKLRTFEPHSDGIHALAGFFVLVLLLVIVLESARSMTSTSTIRLGGLSTSRIKSQKAQLQNWRVGLVFRSHLLHGDRGGWCGELI